MKLFNTVIIGLAVVAASATAQAPVHHWTSIFSSPGIDDPTAIAVTPTGDIVLAGLFDDTINLGGADLVPSGFDMFLAKFDKNGAHLWSQSFDEGNAYAIVVDYAGDIIVTGDFFGTANFGGGNLVSAGLGDIFLARFDADGAHQASQRFGSTGWDRGEDLAVDVGDIVVTGRFRDTVDFGGGGLVSSGNNDIFLAKYDENGVHFWSQRFGDTLDDQGYSVAVDGASSIVLAGTFQNTVSFGGSGLTSNGGWDVFLAKYQPNGNHNWSQSFGSTSTDRQRGLAIDSGDNIVFVGDYPLTIDLGGGSLASAGSFDIFVARYNASGTHLWSQRFGGSEQDNCRGLALDADDDIVITGEYYGAFDFGGGNLPAPDSLSHAYVAQFDENGAHIWSDGFADTVSSHGRGVATDLNSVIVTGFFKTRLDVSGEFHVGDGDSTKLDVFLARFAGEATEPFISGVNDVGNDQGRQVEITFLRSTNDDAGSGTPIINYEIYRRDGIYGMPESDALTLGASSETWTYVGSAPAHGDFSYSVIAPTVADSTIAMGDHNTTFFVRAATNVPAVYFDSDPDSGYSVDNLAPGAPQGFTLNADIVSWEASEAADFGFFAVYGANVDDFGAATLIDYTTALSLDVSASPYAYYFVTAADVSGNEGDPATLDTATDAGGTPIRYVLSVSNYPNPFNPATTVRYTVPTSGPVSIAVFDASGSRVTTLVDKEMHAAGAYRIDWHGSNDAGSRVSSGVYFARIEHAGALRSRKMVLLK